MLDYLRTMDEADLAAVHAIERLSYDYPWTLAGFEKCLDQGLNQVFCDKLDQIIGYCCILPVLDEAHLLNFCVAPAYQRQGIAKKVLLQILEKLKGSGYRTVLLEVRQSNFKARKLYQSMGFTEDGIRKGYYRCKIWSDEVNALVDGKEDAVLMSYRIAKME